VEDPGQLPDSAPLAKLRPSKGNCSTGGTKYSQAVTLGTEAPLAEVLVPYIYSTKSLNTHNVLNIA
jgi:hypothetical protein